MARCAKLRMRMRDNNVVKLLGSYKSQPVQKTCLRCLRLANSLVIEAVSRRSRLQSLLRFIAESFDAERF